MTARDFAARMVPFLTIKKSLKRGNRDGLPVSARMA